MRNPSGVSSHASVPRLVFGRPRPRGRALATWQLLADPSSVVLLHESVEPSSVVLSHESLEFDELAHASAHELHASQNEGP